MERELAKKIIEENLKRYSHLLAVHSWSIHVFFDTIPDEADDHHGHVRANVLRKISYNIASITFDNAKFDTEQELLNSLRHELMHITHAAFDLYYETVMNFVPEDAIPAMRRLYTHAAEQTVVHLQRMFDWNGLHSMGEECTHVKKVEPPAAQKLEPLRNWNVTLDYICGKTGTRVVRTFLVMGIDREDAYHAAKREVQQQDRHMVLVTAKELPPIATP